MSKRNRRKTNTNKPQAKPWNRDFESKKLEQSLDKYFKEREADPNSKIECSICNHSIVDHDDCGCILCFPYASCDMKQIVAMIGNWRVIITEEKINAEKVNRTDK